ncbi:hypothetical protein [Pareuzebyella sediminis]|uniref:hypothetical protein n=1 Tax=Pareuzebyella sediminis TaxID=2607998 RepID=UPI0011ED7BAC|nr:hypothetical protein [Pareuzebyella sediminis]
MARRALYYVENYKIEVIKTFFGKEKVLLNGKKVSEKRIGTGVEHIFSIDKNNYKIVPREATSAKRMNAYEIRKNGNPMALMNAVSTNSLQMFLLIITIGLGCGFLFGMILYKMFFPVSV